MAQPALDEIAADVLARVVATYRGKGLTDAQLAAAGARGVSIALERFVAEHGYDFKTWCTLWVKQAIARAVDEGVPAAPPPAATAALFGTPFVRDVEARKKKLGPKHRKKHAARLAELADAKVTDYGLAFFDLLDEHYDQTIEPWIADQLAQGAAGVNRVVADDEQVDYSEFDIHAISLPADGKTRWTLYIAIDDSDTVAHFAFDGWAFESIGWSD